jgi:type IV pilus assembly protein PilO
MKTVPINQISLENISEWPDIAKWMSCLLLTILVIGLGYFFLISPSLDTLKLLSQEEITLRQSFEQKQQLAVNLPIYREQLTEMKKKFSGMLKELPQQNEMPALLEEISKTGVESGLTFVLFAPQNEIKHDFYIELPIQIEVVGSYHQLALFLSRVASMNRIVTLHNFTIENYQPVQSTNENAKKDALAIPDNLLMNLTAKIYRYRTQG